jgi:uncharacterized protein
MEDDLNTEELQTQRKTLLLIGLVAAAVLAAIIVFAIHHRKLPRLTVSPASVTLSADGAVHRAVEVRLAQGGPLNAQEVTTEGPVATLSQDGDDAVAVDVQSPVIAGTPSLTFRYRAAAATVQIRFLPDNKDSFGDGTPDLLRLHSADDRAAFREWSTMLADTAASLPPDDLPHEINDSASLLRWCYKNALNTHDVPWLATVPLDTMPLLPSVTQYAYPLTGLGSNYFRVRPGPFTEYDLANGSFSVFADAQPLWQFNTFLVSRDIQTARPGDLLFYRHLQQGQPYPAMVLTGKDHAFAVYGTAPDGFGIGGVRGTVHRVTVQNLLQNPDPLWRPIAGNDNFLGVYRWNILREDPQ